MMLSTRFNIVYVCVQAMCPASLRHVLLLRAGLPLVLARRLLRHLHGPRAAAYADERGSAHKTPTSDVIRVPETRMSWRMRVPHTHIALTSTRRRVGAFVHSLGL